MKYLAAFEQVARSRDPSTAIYVNNFMTLFVWRGELLNADRLAELNVRALSWIDEPRPRTRSRFGFEGLAKAD